MSNFNFVDKIRLTTPTCKFQYPKLIEPETKFNPEGVYKIVALIDPRDADPIATALDELLEKHKESLKAQAPTQKFKLVDLPWSYEEVDGTPYFIVKAKMKAKGIDRDGRAWTSAPALFDAKGKPVADRSSLKGMWSGTVGKVSFEACPFYQAAIGAGITLRLKAVQVISLVESSGSADSFGFGEEDGWSPSQEAAVPFDASGSITSDDGDF
jgi:hypothetical protein